MKHPPPPAVFSTAQSESIAVLLNPLRMAADLWNRRQLIRQFTIREVRGRYRGSVLGIFWGLITPLLMLAVYTFVFGYIFSRAEDTTGFALTLFVGIIAFNVFSESVGNASELITKNPNF